MFGRHHFHHHSEREGHFHKGGMKYIILDLIQDKPRYGYEIIRELEERSQGMYAPSAGAVYPTLQMLEEMGYVTSSQSDGKKVYTITDEGRKFLEEKGAEAEEVRKHFKHHWGAMHRGEMMEVMGQMREIFHLLRHQLGSITPEKSRRIREALTKAYGEIETILNEK